MSLFYPFGIPSTSSFATSASYAEHVIKPSYTAPYAVVARTGPKGSRGINSTICPTGYTNALNPTPPYLPVPSNPNVDRSGYILCFPIQPPAASPTQTPTRTPTPTVTPSLSPSRTPTPTPSISFIPAVTPSLTPSLTPTPSVTPSPSAEACTPLVYFCGNTKPELIATSLYYYNLECTLVESCVDYADCGGSNPFCE